MRRSKIAKFLLYTFGVILVTLISVIVYYYPGKSKVSQIEEIPFNFHRDAIIIKGMLNNTGPYNLVLDTGTDPSVVDIHLLDSLSLYKYSIGKQEVGEDEPIEIVVPLPMKLKVGPLPSSRKLFIGLDLQMISSKMGLPVHGILGYNFIKDNILQIDYQDRKLKFLPSDANPYPNRSENVKKMELRFIDDGTFPLIEHLNINGKPIRATIDCGSNKSLTLFRESVDHLGLQNQLDGADEIVSVGYGGEKKYKVMDSIQVSLDNWENLNTAVYFDLWSSKSNVSLDIRGGNIGNGILKKYLLTLDYHNKNVWFEKY